MMAAENIANQKDFPPIAHQADVDKAAYSGIVKAPFGAIGFMAVDGVVTRIEFLPGCQEEKIPADDFSREVSQQINAYLLDPGVDLDFPIEESGTPFQRRVRQEMRNIPPGQALTYGEVARRLQTSPRAVGRACGSNPYVIFFPCHRIVGANGLGGFAHQTDPESLHLGIKKWLLQHEGMLPS